MAHKMQMDNGQAKGVNRCPTAKHQSTRRSTARGVTHDLTRDHHNTERL